MYKYSAIEKTKYINNEFKKYIKSTFQMDDPELLVQFNKQIDEINLTKGPFISLSNPFETGSTITELINKGILSTSFHKMSALRPDRPLFRHQEEAILKAKEGKNLVVSTGTGSGKTESFLIPILDRIARDRENGITECGIQAMLLYPMNALANDQRDRVREILISFPEITFGFYTGETQEHESRAKSDYFAENGRYPLENEIISREKLRESPPNILFTNYSMLEYMLIRPDDGSLFERQNTSEWHYIVLDEAHVYRGAQGIEISLLLKRLLGIINSKPNFILTSATLAHDKKDFPKVITFAERLTNQSFDTSSIIVGHRIKRQIPETLIDFEKSNYKKYLEDESFIEKEYDRYFSESKNNSNEMLYELIINDRNFYEFVDVLKSPRNVSNLLRKLPQSWNEEYVTSLIDVVTRINSSSDLFLVDIRYHTFVKALEGAFVTLKPQKRMFLKKISELEYINERDQIDYIKTFELSLCRHCKAEYLTGKILDNYFYQIDAEEIYENYSEEFNKKYNFLLIKDGFEHEEQLDMDKYLNMNLCNKCGYIYDADEINPTKCNCGSTFEIETVMLREGESNNKTNLTKCINCNSESTTGVIESFYIGKDSASSVVAQLLYKTMGLSKEKKKQKIEITNPFYRVEEEKKDIKRDYVKQFIAFSDSRQQASFFPTYFEEIHTRFLRKRLIVDILEENRQISTLNLINKLEYTIDDKELFNDEEVLPKNQAWISYLREILDVEKKFSLKGLGLMSIRPKIDFDSLDDELIANEFDDMSKKDFVSIIYFIIDKIRSIPATNYQPKAYLPENLRKEHFDYRWGTLNGVVLNSEDKPKYSSSLLPYKTLNNQFTDFLMRSLDIEIEKARDYLGKIWVFLTQNNDAEILSINPDNSAVYTFDVEKFMVLHRKEVDWFQCNLCKTITDINVNNTCVKKSCEGILHEIDPDIANQTNYYYQEYLNKEIENIRIEEHTAQLEKKKGREYQKDFKDGKINILSSSTTFEMGVDIGNLDTVYMRNVPPTPANYVQRAGRAGRRDDTPAYVITFSSNNSHDYTFFSDPVKMIEGKIVPPYFEVENKKIIDRHILSVAMSNFFKVNSDYFRDSGKFMEDGGVEVFKEYILNKKDEFTKYIERSKIDVGFTNRFDSWYEDNISSSDSNLIIMIDDTNEKIRQLEAYSNSGDVDSSKKNRIDKVISRTKSERTLNLLSKYNVIPKYGFPVDTVRLELPLEREVDLSRDLSTAISEYAPESEVIVDKKKYKSRYVALHHNVNPIEYFYKICGNCKALNINLNMKNEDLEKCKNCEEELNEDSNIFVKPIYGFISELEPLSDRSIKPKRTYNGEFHFIGKAESSDEEITIDDVVRVRSVKRNHLAVLNENPFFMCQTCGYTEIDHKNSNFPIKMKSHVLPRSTMKCKSEKLERRSLGHEFRTDVIIIDFMQIDLDYKTAISVMYALLEGVSISFEIERRDIEAIAQNIEGKTQIIMFDSVPGGAGHVKRLLNRDEFISALTKALEKVSQDCCDESASCYNCLRNYSNQRAHAYLRRGLAKEILENVSESLGINSKKVRYQIRNILKENISWEDMNEFLADDELDSFKKEGIRLADYSFADIDFPDNTVSTVLVWEKERIALVENKPDGASKFNDWTLFDFNDLNKVSEIFFGGTHG